jgi:hypothetical protein
MSYAVRYPHISLLYMDAFPFDSGTAKRMHIASWVME